MKRVANEIASAVKTYILEEFLPGEDPEMLDESTPLISGGILDSISIFKLVIYLGERYGVEVLPHEMGLEYMNTVSDIVELVQGKLAEKD